MILFSVKLEVFPYYLLDKAHLTQGRFLAVVPCCALCCRGQSCGMTLWELDCCIWKGRVWGTAGIQAFQASGRKGKPNWVSFFPLWFSFRVTTDKVQTLLFTALLLFWVFKLAETLLFLGNASFPIVLGLSHCLLDPLPALQLQFLKETAVSGKAPALQQAATFGIFIFLF